MNECYVNAIILQNKELDTLTYEHIEEGWIGTHIKHLKFLQHHKIKEIYKYKHYYPKFVYSHWLQR